jgi:hypothetical protein
MGESQELVVAEPQSLAVWTPRFALTVDEAVELVDQKREFMNRVMRKEEHYGVIPGTKGKPSLFKPGAELLLSSMGLHPRYRDTAPAIEDWTGAEHGGEPFFRYRRTCMITRSTGPGPEDYAVIAEAGGNCNSWEKKYRYRASDRMCPTCGKTGTVIKGKQEYGGGWLCFAKKGGCGAKFPFNDKRIQDQNVGEVPNPDIADLVNTLEKMADKRALVAATLLATGCSDIFTQDLEDGVGSADDRGPAVDQDGVISQPSAESLKAVQTGVPVPSSSGPTPIGTQTAQAVATPERPAARSVGPRAKRGNVVTAPQGAQEKDKAAMAPEPQAAHPPAPPETPANVENVRGGFSYRDHGKEGLLANAPRPNEPVGPTALDIAGMQEKVAGMKAKAAERDAASLTGAAEYATALRQSIRESAAQLRQLRVRMQNAEFGVAPVPVPEAVPSTESDDSLSAFIVDQHAKGLLKFSTLAALEGKDLETVGKTLDDLIVRVEAKLK